MRGEEQSKGQEMTEELKKEFDIVYKKRRNFYDRHIRLAGKIGFEVWQKNEMFQFYKKGATENGIQWHDLRKNPDDVPENNDIVLNQKGEYVRYFPEYKTWTWQNCDNYGLEMIAWCEKPMFEE